MLRFCNSHRTGIWTAISFYSPQRCGGEGGNWRNMGWYRIEPNACRVVHNADVSDVNRYWYYYGESDDGRTWSGDYRCFVKRPDAFDICDGIGSTAYFRVGFRQLDVGNADNYTFTFLT